MGMSASQARLIALTARMNDIEYQGQQINQQRTTLSSQINALYNTLLDMSVPTPPSTQDYTKIEYSGTQNATKFTFGSVSPTGKNTSGKDTYSIDFKYQMAGHAVSKNINSATLTNTSQYLSYTQPSETELNYLFKNTTLYKAGNQITSINSENATTDDVMIKTTVEKYNTLDNSDGVIGIYDAQGNDITSSLPEDGVIYIRCNSADINDEQSCANKLIEKNEDNTFANVYACDASNEKNFSTYATDANVAKMGLYYVENPGSKNSKPQKIENLEQLKEAMGNDLNDFSKIYKRDYSGDGTEFTNPNYSSSNENGLSVGDMPVLELAEARGELNSYDDYITALRHSFPEFADYTNDEIAQNFYVYIETSTSGAQIPHFIKKDEMSSFGNNDSMSVRSYEYDADGTYEQIDNKKDCELEFDANTGRITKVGIPDGNGQVIWIALKAETVTDTDAYENAFNEYEYQKYKYDQEQQAINVKTSIIQAEDKNLELKLTRLDNERNALKTEIDAVSKVVSENIEKSFKTFSG